MTEITPYLVLNAYAVGYFPMAEAREDEDIFWVYPEERGVLPLKDFHISRSLKRALKQDPFKRTCNKAFSQVIEACAQRTERRRETWINDQIIQLFTELHKMGYAHSIECWQDEELVGGIYGLALGGAFFAESMFSRATNASKIALVDLVARLRKGEFSLLDVQFVNDHLRQFGAFEMPTEAYKKALANAVSQDITFPCESQIDLSEMAD